jgi:hypothetical protein
MESDLVSEIGSIRQQLHTQQLERERGDQQLAQALREATVRLQVSDSADCTRRHCAQIRGKNENRVGRSCVICCF